jgi:hypothetical protein
MRALPGWRAALLVLAVTAAAGCSRVSLDTPEGFARVEGRGEYRAVSPEGMLLRVRTVANNPRKGPEFWSEALETHLREEGYRPAGPPRPLTSAGGSGFVYEWALPYGQQSYLYLTAVAVQGRRIIVAEAAAPYAVYQLHRQGIYESLQTIRSASRRPTP